MSKNPNTLTKQGFIDEVVLLGERKLKKKFSRAFAKMIVNGIFAEDGILVSSLRKGTQIQIAGFGAFLIKRRAPRIYNLITTTNAAVAEHRIVRFKRGKFLKDIR